MERKMFIQLEVSPSSNYVRVEDMIFQEDIEDSYNNDIKNAKKFGFRNKVETLEGFKLQYILINVEFDGRKKSISEQDVLHTLEKQEKVIKKGESMFGGYYVLTEDLKQQLEDQLRQRKELIAKGEYIELAS